MPKSRNKLTDKQQAFCREYVKNGYNGTKAAISAGYSEITANRIASENLSKPDIQQRIQHHKDHLEELLNISKSKIIEEHAKIAFSSIAHLHQTWITRIEFEELTDQQKACIQEISTKVVKETDDQGKVFCTEYVKIRLYDKQKALDSISKIFGYDAPVKIDGTIKIDSVEFLIKRK